MDSSSTPAPPPPGCLSSFAFVSSVPVVSKSNHRHKSTASASASWRKFKAFEAALAMDARAALPSDWPNLSSDSPLSDRPKVAVLIMASTRIDAANLPKSVTDALEGVCYENDASACFVSCLASRSSTPAAAVALAAFPPRATPEEMFSAFEHLKDLAAGLFAGL